MNRFSFVLIFSLASVLMWGCSNGVSEKLSELNATAIQRLCNSYTFFQVKNGYRGPKSEEQLREFFADPSNKKGFDRAGIDVSDIDALFISPRDNSPFKIKWGVKGSPMGFREAIVFETVGVDGELMVGFGGATTELMSEEESKKLFSAKQSKKMLDRQDDVEDAAVIAE